MVYRIDLWLLKLEWERWKLEFLGMQKSLKIKNCSPQKMIEFRGRIFSHVRPFYEWAVSNLDRSMNHMTITSTLHSPHTLSLPVTCLNHLNPRLLPRSIAHCCANPYPSYVTSLLLPAGCCNVAHIGAFLYGSPKVVKASRISMGLGRSQLVHRRVDTTKNTASVHFQQNFWS